MLYTDLTKTSSVIINNGAEHIVYWGTETADEPLDHGTGGKTILAESEYTGTVQVEFDATTVAAQGTPVLRVMTRHETTAGVPAEVTSSADLDGSAVDATRSVSVTGSVPIDKRLTVVLKNTASTGTITVTRVNIKLLSQAL